MDELNIQKVIELRSEWCEVLTKIENQIIDQRINSGRDKVREEAYIMGKAILDYLKDVDIDIKTKHPIPDLSLIDINDDHRLQTFIILEQMCVLADKSYKEWMESLDETLYFLYPDHHKSIKEIELKKEAI